MLRGDYIGFSAAVALGLWYVLFPNSVIKFNRWFYRGFRSREILLRNEQRKVRIAGAIWTAFVLAVVYFELR